MSTLEAIKAGMTYEQWLATLPDDSWKRQYASQEQGKHWFEAIAAQEAKNTPASLP